MESRDIRETIQTHQVRITDHADEEALADRLPLDDIYFSVLNGEIIEDYPDDQPYPSCLIYGRASNGDPIHSVWGYHKKSRSGVLITVYRPDPERWIHWKTRREKS